MAKYKHKPTIVEAWAVASDDPRPDWIVKEGKEDENFWRVTAMYNNALYEFLMRPGEYIVKDSEGIFVDYKNTLERDYEPVKEN